MSGYRLSSGGRIDRARPLSFRFDGREFQGFEGDTLASALLASGVRLVGRSFKYHRPRGILTAGSEEPNALVELRSGARREPNTRATTVELYEGLEAASQNRFPSLRHDILSVNQYLGRFLVAGFYYKTFMWPASFWELVYEKVIRRSAGLGTASREADPDTYEHAHAHCDVLVVGAGPAGLAAARAAGASGARVLLAEENHSLGGSLASDDEIDGNPAGDWVAAAAQELADLDHVRVMRRTSAVGYYDHNVLVALERVNDHVAMPPAHQPRQRLWTIRARQVVLCTGSHERPLVFAGNDRPGVMLSSAVRRHLDEFGVATGRKVAIVTNNDDAYSTALALHRAGVEVPVIADARESPGPISGEAREACIRVVSRTLPASAKGGHGVTSLVLQRLNGETLKTVACDCVAMSGGYSPNVHLHSQSGASPVWNGDLQCFVPGQPRQGEQSAGACNGAWSLADCLAQGHAAGISAAQAAGRKTRKGKTPLAESWDMAPIEPVWSCPGEGKAFVDFQNDVTAEDVRLAHREGYVSVEHAKRYTTLGMATDQGKTANVNGLAILADARGEPIPDVGTTRFRPPYVPVAIGAYVGRERGKTFQPVRRTAMHRCHEEAGAVFVEAGLWLRPRHYPGPGEDILAAIRREAGHVRKHVGMCDVSTLGKIDIFGPDAAEFLNRLYTNGWSKLPVGKARYGLMLREDGNVYDDGTTSRLAVDHFFMTTTTANAAGVLAHMEYHAQVVWPELDVAFCTATEQWCGVAVAGPEARAVLEDAIGSSIGLSNEALPFMGVREFDWGDGVPARIFRISFSGELAYEVSVPWGYGEHLWNTILKAGEAHNIIPYGTEALNVLRIEKGHVAGNELDGRTTVADMGLGRMMSSKKHFIGQAMAGREGMVEDRATFVGLKPVDPAERLRGGAHLVPSRNANLRESLGWVSSVADSPALGHWIGLGFIKGGLDREGERLIASFPLKDEAVEVEICNPIFVDPEGARVHG